MEKISLKALPAHALPVKPTIHAQATRSPSVGPRVDSSGGWLAPESADGEFFDGLLDQLDPATTQGSGADDSWTGSTQDDSATSTDVGAALDSTRDQRPDTSTDVLQGSVVVTQGPGAAFTVNESTSSGDRAAGWNHDIASTDQFTIDHPRWGLIEVDSRRSVTSWDLTVRCADADTMQRLKNQEHAFHDLLKRDYGASLALDVQSVAAR